MRFMSALAAALSLAVATGCETGGGSKNHDFGDNNPTVVSAMGDSITEMGDPPWPTLLAGMTGMTVLNRGTGGRSSWVGAETVGGALAADKPGYLLIQYGANDCIHGYDPNETIEHLRTMISQAKANKTIPVVANVLPMIAGHESFNGNVLRLNPMIAQLAHEEGVDLADVFGAFEGREEDLLGPDGLHPNQKGNQVIADVFAGAL